MMLKVCNQRSVSLSPFWRGVEFLFDYNFPRDLSLIGNIYKSIQALSPLTIPNYVTASSVEKSIYQDGYVFCEFLEGSVVCETKILPHYIDSLEAHISALHSQFNEHWGSFHSAQFTAEAWPLRLEETIQRLAQHPDNVSLISEELVSKIIEKVALCRPQKFVPLMLDLRWDQFLETEGNLSALIDLDAFVIGPRELDFVVLEYLLTDVECQTFKQRYQEKNDFPDLSTVRAPYRLLLFLMNVLGEKNINSWMESPPRFDR